MPDIGTGSRLRNVSLDKGPAWWLHPNGTKYRVDVIKHTRARVRVRSCEPSAIPRANARATGYYLPGETWLVHPRELVPRRGQMWIPGTI